jgi:hypothetical protein
LNGSAPGNPAKRSFASRRAFSGRQDAKAGECEAPGAAIREGEHIMIANAILSVLATSGPLSLDDIRRMLSHFSYAGLRYRLARLQEDGSIERAGEAYRLRQKVDSQREWAEPAQPAKANRRPGDQEHFRRSRRAAIGVELRTACVTSRPMERLGAAMY